MTMITFIAGLIILIAAELFTGKVCEKIFKPDDRTTPGSNVE